MYLYLDIDGVLNNLSSRSETSAEFHQVNVAAFNKLVRYSDINNIILSSSWRHYIYSGQISLEGFCLMLRTHGIVHTSFLKEIMPKDACEGWERGQSIIEFHGDSKEKAVVLDDLPLQVDHPNIYFYQTNPKEGLTMYDVDKILEKIESWP